MPNSPVLNGLDYWDRVSKFHGINPHTYLVDVLQRISQHPASQVLELTPRVWKDRFAENPLRSDLDLSDSVTHDRITRDNVTPDDSTRA
jgi:transposase IS66-like protein